MQKADFWEKSLMVGKIEGRRRRGHQRMRWLGGITDAMAMNLGKVWEMVRDGRPGVLQFMGSRRVGHSCVTEQQQQSGRRLVSSFTVWHLVLTRVISRLRPA